MKLMHLISGGDVGGAKTHVLTLLAGLRKTHQVRLVCFMEGAFAEEARALGIDTTVLPAKNPLRVTAAIRGMLEKDGADVIHCHGSRANLIGSLLRCRVSAPVVTTVHSDYRLDYLGRPFGRLVYGSINTVALRLLSYRICVSDAMAQTLISRGFHADRLYTIYNGVDFTPRTPKLSRTEYLRSLGLSEWDGCVIFGIAARFSAVKDVATLIRGFGRAAKSCPEARLLLAGDGEERAMLEALAASCCPEGSYRFCGWVSDMDSFYAALDVNTLTSLSETFPYALTEGARMHCATVASRVGGVPDLITDGETGLLFEAGKDDELGKCIALLSKDAALRRQLAQALYEKASRDFSIDATVSRQTEIYETVLRREAQKRQRGGIVISGAYGRGNTGDDAILEAIVAQLREVCPDAPLTVLSRRPRQTELRYRVRSSYTFDPFAFCRAVKGARLFLSGGGSLIQDATSNRSLWYYLWTISTAHRLGAAVMMYGCGIGPVSRPGNRRYTESVLNRCVSLITLREDGSLQELRRLGVTVPQTVTADPAVLLRAATPSQTAAFLRKNGIGETDRLLLISPRAWRTMRSREPELCRAAAELAEKYGLRPVLFAMQPDIDLPICQRMAERLPGAVTVSAPTSGSLVLGVLSRAALVISVRLHTLIFAAGAGTPMVGISYDPKVSGFLRYLGQPDPPELESVTAEELVRRSESALSDAPQTEEKTGQMRLLAQKNAGLAARLWRGEEIAL